MQYGLLPGGVSTAGNKQRNMNHFLPIDGLLVSYEHIRPTANVILVLSKALEKHPQLMEDFRLSKNGYFLTKAVIPVFSVLHGTSGTIAVCQLSCGMSQTPLQPRQSPMSRTCVLILSSIARY